MSNKNESPMYNRIAYLMLDKKMKSVDLSEKLGVTKATFSKWKGNKVQPSFENLFKIAKALDCKPSELVNDDVMKDVTLKVENRRGPTKKDDPPKPKAGKPKAGKPKK